MLLRRRSCLGQRHRYGRHGWMTFQAGALPFGAKIELQAVAARGQ
jgi:enamine deaminase RidA (YjgF/YER057c/UK114 family)